MSTSAPTNDSADQLLTPAEREFCINIAKSGLAPHAVRAQVLLLLDEGRIQKDICQRLKLSLGQLRYALSLYREKGMGMFPATEVMEKAKAKKDVEKEPVKVIETIEPTEAIEPEKTEAKDTAKKVAAIVKNPPKISVKARIKVPVKKESGKVAPETEILEKEFILVPDTPQKIEIIEDTKEHPVKKAAPTVTASSEKKGRKKKFSFEEISNTIAELLGEKEGNTPAQEESVSETSVKKEKKKKAKGAGKKKGKKDKDEAAGKKEKLGKKNGKADDMTEPNELLVKEKKKKKKDKKDKEEKSSKKDKSKKKDDGLDFEKDEKAKKKDKKKKKLS